MLRLGKPGSAGVDERTLPVLSDDARVGTVRHRPVTGSLSWELDVVVDGDAWIMDFRHGATARRTEDPPERVRMRASWPAQQRPIHGRVRKCVPIELEGLTIQMALPRGWRARPTDFFDGEEVVAVGSHNIGLSPRPTLTTRRDLPLHHQVFLLCIVWQRLEAAIRR